MKNYYLLVFLLLGFIGKAQIISIPDANFKSKLLTSNLSNGIAKDINLNNIIVDLNNDNEIQANEALLVYYLDLTSSNIYSIVGINNFINLKYLYAGNNFLNTFDCQGLINLKYLYLFNNQFTTLDVSPLISLLDFDCMSNNLLKILNVKNGRDEVVYFNYNPNLKYVCCDLNETPYIAQRVSEYGYTNCNINSYCTFEPGGILYVVQGNNKFDNENDGCDNNDGFIPNLKYSINNGTSTGQLISNNTGVHSIHVQSGSHTVTPILENPNYFNVSPANVLVNFPTQASPFTQNFCITPNGVVHDVEVSIIPTSVARPGFDCYYQIIYRNKGNQTENGTVNLQFNDAILDFVSSSVINSNQTLNNLNWNYVNLLPLETRTINVVLNLNSPIETPAVNGNDVLNLITTITSPDEVPCNDWLQSRCDNVFTLNQTVVNSYDPNDKTCLQGTTISPDRVGGYVHYMIRFENTGTFPAENIVVKDMIDTAKFNVSSLVPLHASHNYVTKISGNKVEFIFENINLPFDDANNDGYIAFKIKTLPSLVLGDTFSNLANIYFDYNFPIITNTATTTIAALSNPSFEFSNYISLYPNPTTNELNINLKSAIEIHSIQIYNTIGQLVTVQTGNALKVDVSNLKTGNYFIKINTNEGYSTSQFIKE
ncbi:T9SS type A sorting domain-containing protein [Flavobacterium urocaniciphilum]|uniref:Conserved repeat domain-containing protein/Por secretion system C-terminal sorting domain-containing protein n=1 Tax=Flavobacterium urocaniciphilum TaxID=1299341 RepID=A0A1H8Z063_9FLAO|nr:T9SS type A sorting domain-containing protein [Flavobacterium urocaniciphilum]SEP57909.1 conserved repeat domain-containing protein/Por secretion system C-terminal sorting domain-containing protein [Flavobacterium urocaniciphilum]